MLVDAQELHKTYNHSAKAVHVLKGVTVKVAVGDFLAIVGPSGAGKTTLLQVLGGLDQPDSGRVIVDGEEIYKINDARRAGIRNTKIGFVFQFYHLLPEFTALENVLLPALIKGNLKSTAPLEQKGLNLLEKVGLKARAAHRPNQLSGGEQQRVAIARSLMNDPKIIFCDEPTGNLDSQSGQEIVVLLMDLNVRNKQTLVIVTHDEEIARRAHKILHMRDGNLIS